MRPQVYHLTDLNGIGDEYDSHVRIGKGEMDMARALSFVADGSMITVETEKSHRRELSDFEEDVKSLRFCYCKQSDTMGRTG
jgi:hypothetical protein